MGVVLSYFAALADQGLCAILSFAFSGSDGAVLTQVTRAPTNYEVHPFDESCTLKIHVVTCDVLQEPCMSYVLRDVICPSCNDCRDLDLCRDPHLQVCYQLCVRVQIVITCTSPVAQGGTLLSHTCLFTVNACLTQLQAILSMYCSPSALHTAAAYSHSLFSRILVLGVLYFSFACLHQEATVTPLGVCHQHAGRSVASVQYLFLTSILWLSLSRLLTESISCGATVQVHRWNCGACETGYELGAIESALVAVVQQQERAYQLQDLQCTKCKNVSTDQLASLVLLACTAVCCVRGAATPSCGGLIELF